MRKNVRRLALFLAMVLAFTSGAFAMSQKKVDDHTTTDATIPDGTAYKSIKLECGNATVSVDFEEGKKELVKVIYENDGHTESGDPILANGGMYLVTLLTKNAGGDYVPGDGNIQYIDQVTCTTEGKIEFSVYPSAVTDGVIMIYGASGELLAAIIEGAYVLGDVDGNGIIDTADLISLAQYLVGNSAISSKEAADVDVNTTLDSADLILLAQYLVGSASLGK